MAVWLSPGYSWPGAPKPGLKPALAAPTKRRTITPKTIPKVLPREQTLEAHLSGAIAHDGVET